MNQAGGWTQLIYLHPSSGFGVTSGGESFISVSKSGTLEIFFSDIMSWLVVEAKMNETSHRHSAFSSSFCQVFRGENFRKSLKQQPRN